MFTKLFDNSRCLQCKLACGHQDQALDCIVLRIALLQHRNAESSCLSSAVLCTCQDRLAGQCYGNAVLLDWRWLLIPFLENAHEELSLQEVILEVVALCC